MVVGVGGVAVGAEPGAGRPGRAAAGRPTRREAARGLFASVVALAFAPVVAASRPSLPAGGPSGGPADTSFDETYRGRRIRGALVPDARRAADDGEWQVTVDGRPLHLMRRADGTWLSMVDHYSSYPTPLAATRGAVDEMGPGQRLRDPAPGPAGGGHLHMGGDHGVRA
ncbi:tyrosinase family oxidase copper chaperone [Streptomyces sp. NPDC008092]|uniref:tyrosinase family oxidase copper chaperone n=1 Tax=Streptomyces sp. NPDC008092 TaxID=3364808 RepID=UPI0036EC4B84